MEITLTIRNAIVLGSGLTKFMDHFTILSRIPFEDVMPIKFERLDGHERCFYIAQKGSEVFVIISGRFHYYEGFSLDQINAPYEYVIDKYKVSTFVITSSSGGLSAKVKVGEWLQVQSVIALPANVTSSFVGSCNVKNQLTITTLDKANYGYHQGPSLGTLAEYKMLHHLGFDLVGMSMYPEWIFSYKTNANFYFISLPVCNYFPFSEIVEPGHDIVIQNAEKGITHLISLVNNLF